jgi:N-acetylglucosamine repressor
LPSGSKVQNRTVAALTVAETYRGINHRAVKLRNRATVFRVVRDVGPIARIDLARQTGLNAATVTNIVEELLAAHLVEETGQGTSRVGRRPIFLEVNPSARLTLGLDLARDSITGAIVDLAGRVVERFAEPAGPWLDGGVVLSTVGEMVERLRTALRLRQLRLPGNVHRRAAHPGGGPRCPDVR